MGFWRPANVHNLPAGVHKQEAWIPICSYLWNASKFTVSPFLLSAKITYSSKVVKVTSSMWTSTDKCWFIIRLVVGRRVRRRHIACDRCIPRRIQGKPHYYEKSHHTTHSADGLNYRPASLLPSVSKTLCAVDMNVKPMLCLNKLISISYGIIIQHSNQTDLQYGHFRETALGHVHTADKCVNAFYFLCLWLSIATSWHFPLPKKPFKWIHLKMLFLRCHLDSQSVYFWKQWCIIVTWTDSLSAIL